MFGVTGEIEINDLILNTYREILSKVTDIDGSCPTCLKYRLTFVPRIELLKVFHQNMLMGTYYSKNSEDFPVYWEIVGDNSVFIQVQK